MKLTKIAALLAFAGSVGCQGKTHSTMNEQTNPLICDPVEGVCGISDSASTPTSNKRSQTKPVKLIYFTDPICSSCWAIEPQLRKLKLEYGDVVDIEYRMGGLLPDWSYNSGGISKPSDVAHHWDEVSLYYDMPIDGDIWLEDPLSSSFPPSIAFKAAQMQYNEKAQVFLREIREMVFLQKRNITKWENLSEAAQRAGLNVPQFKADMEGKAKQLFEVDLQLARESGVRGFPTIFVVDSLGHSETLYGSKPYAYYENAVVHMYRDAEKKSYSKTWESLFAQYPTLTAREYSELSGTPRNQVESILDQQVAAGRLEKTTTKNGALWRRRR